MLALKMLGLAARPKKFFPGLVAPRHRSQQSGCTISKKQKAVGASPFWTISK